MAAHQDMKYRSRAASPPKAPTFAHSQRFAFDGQSRLPNFLSYGGKESRSLDEHSALTSRQEEQRSEEGDRSHARGWSPLQSHKARTATIFSAVAGDTRFDTLVPPYTEPLGPGSYDVEAASPPLGPFPLDCTQRSGAPGRDPWRPHQAFCSPERPSIFKFSDGHYLGSYLGQDHKGLSPRSTSWSKSSDRRAEVADYRYSTRHSEVDKDVPEAEDQNSPRVDSSGNSVTLATNTHAKATTIPFQSNQVRLALLPRERLNDVRLGTRRLDMDASALGPGAYSPYTSIGGAKRKTYRLYSPEQQQQQQGGRPPASSQTGACSTSFSGISRAHTFGAFSPLADSTLKHWYK